MTDLALAGTVDGEAVRTFSLRGKEYKRGDEVPPLNYRGMVNGGLVKLLVEGVTKRKSKTKYPALSVIMETNFRELRRIAKMHNVTIARTDKTEDIREKLKVAFDY